MDALTVHRLHFAFTVTFHYIFRQLTMGLALRTGEEHYNGETRFWGKIFAINFAMGVVTGIPMEFSLGPTGPLFQGRRRCDLAKHWLWRPGPKAHSFAPFLVFAGSWLSDSSSSVGTSRR